MGSRDLFQRGKAEQWALRLTEVRRSSEVRMPVATSRLWAPAVSASSEVEGEAFLLVVPQKRQWRDWSRLRWR